MKKIRKFTAFWIATIMLLGLMPTTVFATQPIPPGERPMQQRLVSDSIMEVGTSAGDVYNLLVRFTRPHMSAVRDQRIPDNRLQEASDMGPDVWTMHPTHYDVRMRNATLGHVWGENPALPQVTVTPPVDVAQNRTNPPPLRNMVADLRGATLRAASIYEIDIEPVRRIPALAPPPPGSPAGTYQSIVGVPPAIDNSPGLPPARGLLFLTDITPVGEGIGNTITITWPNPTWGGQNVFDYWEVAFDRYDVPGQPIMRPGRVYPVGGPDASANQIRQNPDGTLSLTFFDPTIRPIGFYQVRVEPMLSFTQRVRPPFTAGAAPIHHTPFTYDNRHFDLYFTRNEYVTVVPMVPRLNLEHVGADFIRLWWSQLTGLMTGDPDSRVTRVVLEEWSPEATDTTNMNYFIRNLATLTGSQIEEINEWPIGPGIPRERRAFVLALRIGYPPNYTWHRTNIVIYNPLDAEFSPYRPEIISLAHEGDGRLSMEWLGFARFPVVYEEEGLRDPAYGGRFVDTAMQYEIFVSDSWETLVNLSEPLMVKNADMQEIERDRIPTRTQPQPYPPVWDPIWRLWPFDHISQYQARTPTGTVTRSIQGNRVYFVRIRAVRLIGGEVSEWTSEWAYGSVFVPPLDGLEVTPEMISAPPVRVDHENVGPTTIPIYWDMRFLEIMQYNPRADWAPDRNVWHTVVGVDRANRLIFGRSAAHINYVVGEHAVDPGAEARHRIINEIIRPPSLRDRLLGLGLNPLNPRNPSEVGYFLTQSRGYVNTFLTGLGHTATTPTALRIQDMSTFNFEIHVVPYDVMVEAGGYEVYRDSVRNMHGAWTSIGRPTPEDGVMHVTVAGLTTNTSYVIFVRPYTTIGANTLRAAFPTFVIGTTVDDPYRPVPDPTTPVLHEVPEYTRRDRVAVRWRVQSDMIYELRISHFFTDYYSGGTVIPISFENITDALAGQNVELEEPRAVLFVREVNGVPYFHLRIYERFPGTLYYVWARAIGVDSQGNVATPPSLPSNPVDIRTLDIEPPPPPRSFARAPQNLLNTFNRYNDTEYESDEPYAMTLSWMRILADLRDDDGNLRERAESGTGDGNIRPLNLPNIDATPAYAALHLLRFEELRANQNYYARARTFLTVQRDRPDIYSYEIQFADNPDFLDAMTFTIPPLPAFDSINMRRAYSEWVYLETATGVSADEFDGVHRPDQYPLPERDWEITYNPGTQTLTWRFRTNQRGADGRLDQNVDQRFITRLIQSRTFVYTINLSSYGDMPISNREVIIPESILRAFGERQITLEILAGEHNVQIPPGAFDTAQTRGLQPGIGSYYTINLNAVMSGMPPLTTNTEFATVPQRFNVQLETPTRHATNLTTFARPINIDLPVEDHIAPEGLRTGLFILDTNTASWRDTQGQFNFATEILRSDIQAPTTFAGISRNAPPSDLANDRANAPMGRVTANLNITDLVRFNPADEVTQIQFNNLVNAVAQNQTTVTMNANLPASAAQSMTRARIFAQPDFTREVALDILVRLYETRTRQILTPMTAVDSIPGMQNADPSLHRNLRIAADLGFITGPVEPEGALTMGEMMNILDIIIQDAR